MKVRLKEIIYISNNKNIYIGTILDVHKCKENRYPYYVISENSINPIDWVGYILDDSQFELLDETDYLNSTGANKKNLEKSIKDLNNKNTKSLDIDDLYCSDDFAGRRNFELNNKSVGGEITCTNINDFVKNGQVKHVDISKERVYESGARRASNINKPFIHNLQAYTLLRFGYLTNMGAREYGDGNFLKGFPDENAIESLLRHITLFRYGDTSEDHLASALFNIQLLMLNQEKAGIKPDQWFKKISE